MMTGDSERTARAIRRRRVGVGARIYSEVLPEDKAAFVEKEKKAGRRVIMVGDGIDVFAGAFRRRCGASPSAKGRRLQGRLLTSRFPRECPHAARDLKGLRSNALMRRVNPELPVCHRVRTEFRPDSPWRWREIPAPAASALLHNTSTRLVSMKSMTNLLEKEEGQKARGIKWFAPGEYDSDRPACSPAHSVYKLSTKWFGILLPVFFKDAGFVSVQV